MVKDKNKERIPNSVMMNFRKDVERKKRELFIKQSKVLVYSQDYDETDNKN